MWKLPNKITIWGSSLRKVVPQTRFIAKNKNYIASDEYYKTSELENIVKGGSKLTKKLKEFPPKKDLEHSPPIKSKAFIPSDTLKERLSYSQEDVIDESDAFDISDSISQNETNSDKRELKFVIPEQRAPNIILLGNTWKTSAKGTRKRAVAITELKPGTGNISVNNSHFLHYFPSVVSRESVLLPFLVTEKLGQFDLSCKVAGGGKSGISLSLSI
jgi:hypothetical protein